LEYTLTVPYDVKTVYVEGFPEAGTLVDYRRSADGEARDYGEFDFAEGDSLEVLVRAWRDAMMDQIYVLRIQRDLRDARLEGLELYAGPERGVYYTGGDGKDDDLLKDQNFAPAGTELNGFTYRAAARYDTRILRVLGRPQPGVAYRIEAEDAAVYPDTGEVSFEGQELRITVHTSGPGMADQSYGILVSRDIPRAYLQTLKVYLNGDTSQDALAGYNFSYAREEYRLEIPYNTETLAFEPGPETPDLLTAYREGGQEAGEEMDISALAEAEIEVTVYHPEDYKAPTVYRLTLIRQQPSASLAGLEVCLDGGSENVFTAEAGYIWNPMIRDYRIEVPYGTETVKLKADKGETPDAYLEYRWGTEEAEDRNAGRFAERTYNIADLDRGSLAALPVEITTGHEFLRSATYTISLVRQTFTAYLKEEEGLHVGTDRDSANGISPWVNINGTYTMHVPYNAKKITVKAAVMEALAGDGQVEIACDLDGAPGAGDIRTGTEFDIAAKKLTGLEGEGVLTVTVSRKFLSPMLYQVLIIRDTPTAYLGSLSLKGNQGDENLLKDFYKAGGNYNITVPYNTTVLSAALSPDGGNPDAEVHYSPGGGPEKKVENGAFSLDISGITTAADPEDRVLTITVSRLHLTSMAYRVTINREPKTAYLSALDYTARDGGQTALEKLGAWTFNGYNTRYEVKLPHQTADLVFTAAAAESGAALSWTLDGEPLSGGGDTGAAADLRDKPAAEVRITAGGPYLESTEYLISLSRQEGYAYLGGIEISDNSDNYQTNRLEENSFNRAVQKYNIRVPYTAGMLRVRPRRHANNPDAVVKVSLGEGGYTEEADGVWDFPLAGAEAALKVRVERDYLEAVDYTFSLTRVRPMAYLNGLAVKTRGNGGQTSGGSLTAVPVQDFKFSPAGTDYLIPVPWDAYEVILEADPLAGTELSEALQDEAPHGGGLVFPFPEGKKETRISLSWAHPGGMAEPVSYTLTLSRRPVKAVLTGIVLEADDDDDDNDGGAFVHDPGLIQEGLGAFDAGTTIYTAVVDAETDRVRVTGLGAAASYRIEGGNPSASPQIADFTGTMKVEIRVTAPFKEETLYTVIVRRPGSYSITVPAVAGGEAEVTALIGGRRVKVENAPAGSPGLRFTVKADLGYVLESLDAGGISLDLEDLTEDGEGGWYRDFTMPAKDVSFTPGYWEVPSTPGVLYAAERGRAAGEGGADGSSWSRAVTDLQWLIDNKFDGSTYREIWIEGALHPESWAAGIEDRGSERNKAFVLKGGVKLYGGFEGLEWDAASAAAGRAMRRQEQESGAFVRESVLEGEQGRGLRSYHVVVIAGISGDPPELRDLSVRNGLAVQDGTMRVNGVSLDNRDGAGIYCQGASLALENLRVADNTAIRNGGGIYIDGASPVLENLRVEGNISENGGGIYFNGTSPVLRNLRVEGNIARGSGSGGGAYFTGAVNPSLDTVAFTGNVAGYGGGVYYTGGNGSTSVWKDVAFIENTSQRELLGLGSGYNIRSGGLYWSGSGDLILESPVFRRNTGGSYFTGSVPHTVAVTGGLWEGNNPNSASPLLLGGLGADANIRMIIKDGVFSQNSINIAGNSSNSFSGINLRIIDSPVRVSGLAHAELINISTTSHFSISGLSASGKVCIYNSNMADPSYIFFSSRVQIQSSPTLMVRKSIIGSARTGDAYQDSYKSLTANPSTGYSETYQVFSGFSVTTTPYGNDAYAIPVDMTDFVESEQNQGSDAYYPDSAAEFNNTYYGGALSAGVVEALEKDWDKDLAGNDRFGQGAAIDAGPYEVQE
jgi:hypothetical protein